MKALSVRQPWAELIARGRKTLEVRSWRTAHRGPLVICAGKAWHPAGAEAFGRLGSRGVAVCLVRLVDCRPMREGEKDERASMVGYEPGAFVFVLELVRRLPPVPVAGRLRTFTLAPEETAGLKRRPRS